MEEKSRTAFRPVAGLSVGQHLLADLYGIDPKLLMDEQQLMEIFTETLLATKFQILGQQSYRFPGEESGVTGFVLLSESHAAFHSYPEYGYLAVDIFSCGLACPRDALRELRTRLLPTSCSISHHSRGHRQPPSSSE